MQIPRLPTNTPLDRILGGGLEHGVVTNIYGPPGSGKTNIALAALLGVKKALYIDTESSFSPERFYQLGGARKRMQSIILIEPSSWKEQHEAILQLEKKSNGAGIIIVDSIVSLYRLELDKDNFVLVNRQLATQYSQLSSIARKHSIPVLVTNQVYSVGEDKVEMSSRQVARYWSKCIVELKHGKKPGQRIAVLHKHRSAPEGRQVSFEILHDKLKEIRFVF